MSVPNFQLDIETVGLSLSILNATFPKTGCFRPEKVLKGRGQIMIIQVNRGRVFSFPTTGERSQRLCVQPAKVLKVKLFGFHPCAFKLSGKFVTYSTYSRKFSIVFLHTSQLKASVLFLILGGIISLLPYLYFLLHFYALVMMQDYTIHKPSYCFGECLYLFYT